MLTTHFAGAGWQCDALLAAAARADDFYFDAFAQVHMSTISQGLVTLVGDAGYCASPLSGMGTSLALVGAYVLAGELGPADALDVNKIKAALTRYESVMRPYIDRCQDLPNGIDGYLPKSASDIAVTAQVMKWMQRWPFRSFAEKKVVHHRRRDRATGIRVRGHLTQHDSSHGARDCSAALSLASAMR